MRVLKNALVFVVQKIGEGGPTPSSAPGNNCNVESSKSHFDVRKKANGMQTQE